MCRELSRSRFFRLKGQTGLQVDHAKLHRHHQIAVVSGGAVDVRVVVVGIVVVLHGHVKCRHQLLHPGDPGHGTGIGVRFIRQWYGLILDGVFRWQLRVLGRLGLLAGLLRLLRFCRCFCFVCPLRRLSRDLFGNDLLLSRIGCSKLLGHGGYRQHCRQHQHGHQQTCDPLFHTLFLLCSFSFQRGAPHIAPYFTNISVPPTGISGKAGIYGVLHEILKQNLTIRITADKKREKPQIAAASPVLLVLLWTCLADFISDFSLYSRQLVQSPRRGTADGIPLQCMESTFGGIMKPPRRGVGKLPIMGSVLTRSR